MEIFSGGLFDMFSILVLTCSFSSVNLYVNQQKELKMNEENYTRTEDENGVITFTPINKGVRCWKNLREIEGYFSDSNSAISSAKGNRTLSCNENIFATEEQCKASIALAMLSQLMKECNGGWVPDWSNGFSRKRCIYFVNSTPRISSHTLAQKFLAFGTVEIRDRFLELHIDLINQAKPLL